MKKGITVYTEYDRCGRWTLIVEKEKGKLTLDEIRQAATELYGLSRRQVSVSERTAGGE